MMGSPIPPFEETMLQPRSTPSSLTFLKLYSSSSGELGVMHCPVVVVSFLAVRIVKWGNNQVPYNH